MTEKIDHPPHYGGDTVYEHIKVIEAWGLLGNYPLAIALKHVCRAGKKDGSPVLEDLKKARWYLDWEIQRLERDSVEDIRPTKVWEPFKDSIPALPMAAPTISPTIPPAPHFSTANLDATGGYLPAQRPVDGVDWQIGGREFSSMSAAENWMASMGVRWVSTSWERGHGAMRYNGQHGPVARVKEVNSVFHLTMIDVVEDPSETGEPNEWERRADLEMRGL